MLRIVAALCAAIALACALAYAGYSGYVVLVTPLGPAGAAAIVALLYAGVAAVMALLATMPAPSHHAQAASAGNREKTNPALAMLAPIAREKPLLAVALAAGLGVVSAVTSGRDA